MVRRHKQSANFADDLVAAGKNFLRGIWDGMGPDLRKTEEPRRKHRGKKA